MANHIRAFIAVKVPAGPALRSVLSRLGGMGRAVGAENLHVTLKFLGDTPLEQVPEIGRVLREVVETKPACDLRVVGLGAFPHPGRPSVIWAGLEGGETLAEIAGELQRKMKPLGFAPEKRQFKPHLTLARIKFRPPDDLHELLREHATTEFGTASVDAVKLFQSELTPEGPQYTVLQSVELSGG